MLLGNKELVDNLTLGEQGVKEGSVLRLVISLKGGPIQARKPLPPEDQLWREVSEMMEDKRWVQGSFTLVDSTRAIGKYFSAYFQTILILHCREIVHMGFFPTISGKFVNVLSV